MCNHSHTHTHSWHYACTDLQQLLQIGLAPVVEEEGEREGGESGVHRILGFGFYSDPDPERRGFYVDEVSFSSEERIFDWDSVSWCDNYYVCVSLLW